MSKSKKSGRIELRTEQARESRLRYAADLSHMSLSAFILDAASARAEDVIAQASTTPLPAQFFDRLWSSLDAAPRPNAALARRARARRRVTQQGA